MKYKSLANILRARISTLPDGSRLPSLRTLKQKTGFSIQTINSAVSLLEREGVLVRRHGSGLYVSTQSGTRHISFCRSTFPSINMQIKEEGLSQACSRRGWIMTTHQFRSDGPDLFEHEVRGHGVVLFPDILNFEYGIAKSLLALKVPVVSLGSVSESGPIDYVSGDDLAALGLILKKLVSLGHRRIAYLNTEPACYNVDLKLENFKNLTGVLDIGQCPVIECHTKTGQKSNEPAAHALHNYLSAHRERLPFTALVSCSSPGGIVAMRVLHEFGWRVPADCSVICMQEDPLAPYTVPALTNLKWDYPSWGEHCIALIEKRLKGEAPPELQAFKIIPEFNWRESVAEAPL